MNPTSNEPGNYWRRCSSCKRPIGFNVSYYVCSVSTCNGLRTGYVFCSVNCYERHLPGARHKQSGAIEKISPRTQDAAGSPPPPVSIGSSSTLGSAMSSSSRESAGRDITQREILIIASRLKEYIAARADYNTSGAVMEVLSDYVRVLCDRAIDQARAEGRRTVLDRDFDFLKKT